MKKRIKKIKLFIMLSCVLAMLSFLRPLAVNACCNDNDFWCWVGVVATGGVSCAVEDAINTIKTIIASVQSLQATITTNVNNLINQAMQTITAAGSDLSKLTQNAQNDFNIALTSAQQLANSAQAQAPATNATPQAANIDAMLRQTMPRARDEIEKIKPSLMANASTVQQAAATAKNQVQANIQTVRDIVQTALMAPLDSAKAILDNLLKNPQQIINPNALVDPIIMSVTAQLNQTMTRVTNQLISNANATLQTARPLAQSAMDQAAHARMIFQAMQAANSQRTQASLDQLLALLPPQPVMGTAPVTATMAGGVPTKTGTPAGNGTSTGSGGSTVSVAAAPAGNTTGPMAGGVPMGEMVKPAGDQLAVSRGIVSIPAHQKMTTDVLARIGSVHNQGQTFAATWKSSLDRDLNELKMKQQMLQQPVMPVGANESFRARADELMANQDRQQLQATRIKLIDEARKRFANDPKTLAKVEQLLGQEIDRRQGLLSRVPLRNAPR